MKLKTPADFRPKNVWPKTPPLKRERIMLYPYEVWRGTVHGQVMSAKNSRLPVSSQKDDWGSIGAGVNLPPSKATLRVIPSKQAQRWKRDASPQFNLLRSKFLAAVANNKLEPPFFVGFQFVRSVNARFDFNNLTHGCTDMMSEAGWIEDDNASILYPLPLPYCLDAKNPGVDIVLFCQYPLVFRGEG